MMKLSSPWRKAASHVSVLWFKSRSVPGVRFSIKKVSLGQRIRLSSKIRELTLRNEFLRAGAITDQLEASMADLLVKKLYVEWATAEIDGLVIDGKRCSVQCLVENGPEDLVSEIASAAQSQLELSDDERKN